MTSSLDLAGATSPVTVLYDSMEKSSAVEQEVVAWLDKMSARMTSAGVSGGYVMVQRLAERIHGQGMRYHIRMELTTAGRSITIGDQKTVARPHEDVCIAIRDAFRDLRRRLDQGPPPGPGDAIV